MSEVVKLEIPCAPGYITVARKAVEALAGKTMLTEEQLADVKLAVGEACTNAVKYSSPGTPVIHVVYRLESDRLEIEVRNAGKPFHFHVPSELSSSVDDLANGRMGLYLVSRVMDELSVTWRSGRTTLRMIKFLKRGDSEMSARPKSMSVQQPSSQPRSAP